MPARLNPFVATVSLRRAVALVLVAALLLGGVAVLLAATSSGGTTAQARVDTTAVPTTTATAAEQVFTASQPGDCLTWTAPTVSDLSVVDCATPHRFEVAAVLDLSTRPEPELAATAPLPGADTFTHLRDTLCVPAVTSYLGGRFDPYGLFTVGLIDPGELAWDSGERSVRCGLQHVGSQGEQFPIVGRVSELDQSDVAPVGSCADISAAGLPSDPVDCRQPHASEVVAVLHLAGRFPGAFPAVAEQDAFLDEACRTAAAAALGGPDAASARGLTVFWTNLRPESWAAGSRSVSCLVGARLPAGGFAPLLGSATAPASPAPAASPPPAPAVAPPVPDATIQGG
ncbi:septum formation family protein [Rhodococcus sp. X156]|uniref:septum formation family protein n=1 Tax=Rhodococcus sp. X156 TaxID=2499145 RepID=UPI000FDBD820|nr:septum formation family protein [Rhodococcus sp. X156]